MNQGDVRILLRLSGCGRTGLRFTLGALKQRMVKESLPIVGEGVLAICAHPGFCDDQVMQVVIMEHRA